MTKTMVGAPASVVEALRRVWPRYTAKAAARAAGKSVYTGESWVQGRKRGDWDALVKLMAANAEMEREILALVRAERGKALDATGDGRGHGMAPQARRVGAGGVAHGPAVPGHAPAGVPAGATGAGRGTGCSAFAVGCAAPSGIRSECPSYAPTRGLGETSGAAAGGTGLTHRTDAGGSDRDTAEKVARGGAAFAPPAPSHDNQQGD